MPLPLLLIQLFFSKSKTNSNWHRIVQCHCTDRGGCCEESCGNVAWSRENPCVIPLCSVHLSARLGKRLHRVPTHTRLVPLGSAERASARGAVLQACPRALRRPGRAHTAAAPDSQPQNEVGRTLSPAPSGEEDSGETRGSCVIFL